MLITTTDTLQDFRIERYLGIVAGHSVLGDGVTKKFRTGIRDVSAGYPHDYGQELDKAREAALDDLAQRAARLGANAVLGARVAFAMSGDSVRTVIVSASGTAVVLAGIGEDRATLRRVETDSAAEPDAGMKVIGKR